MVEKGDVATPETTHEFHFPEYENRVIELTVPFSSGEISEIETARQTKQKWSDEATSGSGIARELLLSLTIPYGHSLKDRQNALEEIRKSILYLRTQREAAIRQGRGDIVSDLDQIEISLLTIVPDMKEEESNKS